MKKEIHRYQGDDGLEVTWDKERCIHFAACVHSLPQVFDPEDKPWVQPEAASDDEVARSVNLCPTGALAIHGHESADGPPRPNRLEVAADGPIYVRGDLELRSADGEVLLEDTRMALCRCGVSGNKPLCDNSHRDAEFSDEGALGETKLSADGETAEGRLVLKATEDGPVVLDGPFEITTSGGRTVRGEKAALCRCGESGNKPFCDGSHVGADFEAG